MAVEDFIDWMNNFARAEVVFYIKRLAANDTLATGAHQAGPYMPRKFLFQLFPALDRPDSSNPDVTFPLSIDSHGDSRQIRAVWYNNIMRGGTRNEARLTGFGGASSALLDPDSTGALAIFAFLQGPVEETLKCRVWVCRNLVEEELVEERLGPIEPGRFLIWRPDDTISLGIIAAHPAVRRNCRLAREEIPEPWLESFPTGAEIIRKTVELRPGKGVGPDELLMQRRKCEYEIFLSVEEAIELPVIHAGFTRIDDFVARAQSILQRRKARSGRSLELHFREILVEAGLREGQEFAHGRQSEEGRRPDFLFPSQANYRNAAFPAHRLRMLAVKTTCRDRWRQILNEADRIATKHLLTLQEGVSLGQFREMKESGVRLVVPRPLIKSYPAKIRPELLPIESFIADVSTLSD